MNKEPLSDKFAKRIAESTPEITQLQKEQSQNYQSSSPVAPPTPPAISVMPVEFPAGDPEVIRVRHQESVKNHPDISVDEDEFVVLALRRHWIGLIGIVFVSLSLFVVLVSAWILLCFTPNNFNITDEMKNSLSLIFAPLSVLIAVAGYIGYTTYKANRFIVTNERAVQIIVRGLMDQKKQVINLESAEDISFTQKGIFQHLLDYGTIRLSTTGDETTYTFPLAKNPAKAAEILGEVAESARENQPVPDEIYEFAKKMR